jgi:hypothetical protein
VQGIAHAIGGCAPIDAETDSTFLYKEGPVEKPYLCKMYISMAEKGGMNLF